MPLFGFIPQWLWLIPITFSIGFTYGMVAMRSFQTALVQGPALSLIVLGVTAVRAKAQRNAARLAGLCTKRILTITPEGLILEVPERGYSPAGTGVRRPG